MKIKSKGLDDDDDDENIGKRKKKIQMYQIKFSIFSHKNIYFLAVL